MSAEPVAIAVPAPEIPDKLYFRIGDVSRLAGVKPFVLRFWEQEFSQIAPKKSGTGHRLYRRKDVEMVLEIKRLLYDERFTIEGARNYLQSRGITSSTKMEAKNHPKRSKAVADPAPALQGSLFAGGNLSSNALDEIRQELRSIVDLLS